MKPDISEFSYGYALTDELMHWHSTGITAVPVFPSLYDEGQPGGGWDVRLDRAGIPLFLQFKLADRMVRGTAKEVLSGLFACPFYRMHLRPKRHSNQHEMLLELEAKGQEVYYSAPAFDTPGELNDAYLTHQVKQRSVWIKPSAIGTLPDEKDHHVAFTLGGPFAVCSDPRSIDVKADFITFAEHVEKTVKARSDSALKDENLAALADSMEAIAKKRKGISSKQKSDTKEALKGRQPIQRISAYASMFFGSQLFIATTNDSVP